MKLRHLSISHFRGIASLDWPISADHVCLIGPGDSGKSTILDAIELALSPRWSVAFTDVDFHQADTSIPIEIVVSLGDLPEELLSDAKFGLHLRGWQDGQLRADPGAGELVISVRLRVDDTLEPTWSVVTDAEPEGKAIRARERELVGCVRIGSYVDRHFSWARGSVLTRLTAGTEDADSILSVATRGFRGAFADVDLERMPGMKSAAAAATAAAKDLGVRLSEELRPHLDVDAISIGSSGLSLHQAGVPVRKLGLGSRRLLAVALQRQAAEGAGIILLDELEHGLEPHRVRQLARLLAAETGQVFTTTHSPVAVGELEASMLHVVRTRNNQTTVLQIPADVQGHVRIATEAVLAQKIIVCEGMTELGLCSGLLKPDQDYGHLGIGLVHAGGCSKVGKTSFALARLGYQVAALADSDRDLDKSPAEFASAGVTLIRWDGTVATEERIALDLPQDGLTALIEYAIQVRSHQTVRDAVAGQLSIPPRQLGEDVLSWHTHPRLGEAFGKAAKSGDWFKTKDLAEPLAELVLRYAAPSGGTDILNKFNYLRRWVEQ